MLCPSGYSREDLTAFTLGELEETRIDGVADHLDHCPACAAAVRELERAASPLVLALRQAGAIPRQVGPYDVLEEAGRGGMGVVYKARHAVLDRVVALKLMSGAAMGDPELLQRFHAEAQAVARLEHPNIVRLLEAGEQNGAGPYLALEYVPGGSLTRRIAGQPQPPALAAGWVEPLARAVQHAHENGVLHRDIKPANVLLDAAGVPRLCDFGVARLVGGSRQTRTGFAVGTVEYMAPEQADPAVEVGPAADVYSLGAVLYTALTGRPPFQGSSPAETLALLLNQDPVAPRRLVPAVPRDLETICLKCLHKQPACRYASAAALADDLRRFLDGWPILARPAGAAERACKAARRHPLAAALFLLAITATALAFAGGAYHNARLRAEMEQTRQAQQRADENARVVAAQLDRALRAFRWMAEDVESLMLHNPQMAFGKGRFMERTVEELERLATVSTVSDDPLSAEAHGRLADLYQALGRHPEATRQYRLLRDQADRCLAEDDAAPAARSMWLRATAGLAESARKTGAGAGFDPDQAERVARRWIAEGTREAAAYRLLGLCHRHQMHRATEKLELVQRRRRAETALADALAWAEAAPSDEAVYAVARAYFGLGIDPSAPDPKAAADHLRAAVRWQQDHARRRPGDYQVKRNLAAIQDGVAMAWFRRGEYGLAREAAEAALKLLREITAARPDVPQFQRDLVSPLLTIGGLAKTEGRHSECLTAVQEALHILERLDALGLLTNRKDDQTLMASCRQAIAKVEALRKGGQR